MLFHWCRDIFPIAICTFHAEELHSCVFLKPSWYLTDVESNSIFYIVGSSALSVSSCVHVSTSWMPLIESSWIQTLLAAQLHHATTRSIQPQPNVAVTLQMSYSSFPPRWRKTELVKKEKEKKKAHQIRDDPFKWWITSESAYSFPR